jgi:hypothetical protein
MQPEITAIINTCFLDGVRCYKPFITNIYGEQWEGHLTDERAEAVRELREQLLTAYECD